MKLRIEQPRLMIISFLIIYLLSGFQFFDRHSDFLKLKNNGIETTAKRTCIPINRLIVKYRLEFLKADNSLFSKTTTTIDERDYVKEKPEFEIIYLIDNPEKYWELKDFKNYSLGGSIFFFFGPYGLIGTLVLYGFLKFANYLRFKKNRDEIKKTLHNMQYSQKGC